MCFASALALSLAVTAGPSRAVSEPCRVEQTVVLLRDVTEASGVAVSQRTPGRLWVHNDSGEPVLFAIDSSGAVKQRVRVTGAKVRDWEDVAVAPCSNGSCLYIADIGDNHPSRREVTIYRAPEPAAGESETNAAEAFVGEYPDGPHDAEAFFVIGREMFVITKENPAALFRFPTSPPPGAAIKLQHVKTLTTTKGKVTGANASVDGRWVALRTHETVSFFRADELTSTRRSTPVEVDVKSLGERQGEGVAFGAEGAVFLVGEGGGGHRPGTLAKLRCTL